MNIHEQKEFIKDLMSMDESFKDPMHKDFYKKSVSDFNKGLSDHFKQAGLPDISDAKFDMNELMEMCKDADIEPIEMIDWAFNMVASAGTIEVAGQTIDLSKAKDALAEYKEKFKSFKDQEDINKL